MPRVDEEDCSGQDWVPHDMCFIWYIWCRPQGTAPGAMQLRCCGEVWVGVLPALVKIKADAQSVSTKRDNTTETAPLPPSDSWCNAKEVVDPIVCLLRCYELVEALQGLPEPALVGMQREDGVWRPCSELLSASRKAGLGRHWAREALPPSARGAESRRLWLGLRGTQNFDSGDGTQKSTYASRAYFCECLEQWPLPRPLARTSWKHSQRLHADKCRATP